MTLKLKKQHLGGHIHVDVFSGPDADHLALAGSLVFLPAECDEFCRAITSLGYSCVDVPPNQLYLGKIHRGGNR